MARRSIVILAALLAGCGSQRPTPINTGLAHAGGRPAPEAPPQAAPKPKESVPDWANQPSVDVASLVDKPAAPGNRIYGTNEQPPITEKDGPTRLPAADGSHVMVTVNPLEPEAPVETIGNGSAKSSKPIEQRIEDATVSLADLLAQQAVSGTPPWKSYAALAALDTLHPGALPRVITPSETEGGPLSGDDRQAVEALREFFAGITAIPQEATPDQRGDRLEELTDQLLGNRPMRIRASALCSRVTGFGQYTPMPSTRFAQGRAVRAIVYTEVARFGHRPVGQSEPAAATGDRWVVDLTQTLQVYHDPDGVLAWSRPEERITEASRNRRHDFFLVHDITLPPTLTIGAYNLKVIMKDKTTGQQDEAIIPFQIVTETQANGG